jgi:hypothetical protein
LVFCCGRGEVAEVAVVEPVALAQVVGVGMRAVAPETPAGLSVH